MNSEVQNKLKCETTSSSEFVQAAFMLVKASFFPPAFILGKKTGSE